MKNQQKPLYKSRIGIRVIIALVAIFIAVGQKACAQKKVLTTGVYIVTQAKQFRKTVVVRFKETGYKEWVFDKSLFVARKGDTIYWMNRKDTANQLIINVE
jgi:hypothetical protein